MTKPTQGPLNWHVPIVDSYGFPTPEFMRKWQRQGEINNVIPELGSAAQVSAILDLIGSTPGDILIRGTTYWQRLATAADTTKFLNGNGAYAKPSVTALGGFSGVATEYLDGTGAFSTPAGGGGGGGGGPTILYASAEVGGLSSSAYAAKGAKIVPAIGIKIRGAWFYVSEVSGATYRAQLWSLAGTKLGTKLAETTDYTAVASGDNVRVFTFSSPASLTAGNSYAILHVRTDSSGSTASGLFSGSGPAWGIPVGMENTYIRVASADPAPGATYSSGSNTFYHGLIWSTVASGGGSGRPAGAVIYNSGSQSQSGFTNTYLNMPTTLYDDDSFVTGTTPGEITIPSGYAYARITGVAVISDSQVLINRDTGSGFTAAWPGVGEQGGSNVAGQRHNLASAIIPVATGDKFRLLSRGQSGSITDAWMGVEAWAA